MPVDGVLKQASESDSLDTVFTLLSSQRRRYILYYLHQRGALDVEDLAELIAASETSGDRATVTVDEQEAVLIGLIHTHLPQLVEARLIEYDDSTQRVRLGAEIPHLRSHLTEAATVDIP